MMAPLVLAEGRAKVRAAKENNIWKYSRWGASAGAPNEEGCHPFGQTGMLDGQAQGQDTDEEVGDGLRKTVQCGSHIRGCPHQDQQHHAQDAGHRDRYGLGGPQHDGQRHYRQCPLTLCGETVGRGH